MYSPHLRFKVLALQSENHSLLSCSWPGATRAHQRPARHRFFPPPIGPTLTATCPSSPAAQEALVGSDRPPRPSVTPLRRQSLRSSCHPSLPRPRLPRCRLSTSAATCVPVPIEASCPARPSSLIRQSPPTRHLSLLTCRISAATVWRPHPCIRHPLLAVAS